MGMGYDLTQRLNQIERNVHDLATQPVLLHASTGQDGGQGLSTDKNGLHLFNPAGVEVATLSTIDGSATFGANVIINGNLSVPNGSISNTALQNPLNTGSVGGSTSGFATTSSVTQQCLLTITVPTGYTKATVLCNAAVSVVNSTASADYLYVSAYAGSGSGGETVAYTPAGAEAGATASAINTFTGLSGGTITVASQVRTGAAWASSGANIANTNAVVFFTR